LAITTLRTGPVCALQQRQASLQLLAVMGEQRSPDSPNTPVVPETAEMARFQVSLWNALAAPIQHPNLRRSQVIQKAGITQQ
jgi:tripartite-type tricarboxylate transporter receptor subunit TctC